MSIWSWPIYEDIGGRPGAGGCLGARPGGLRLSPASFTVETRPRVHQLTLNSSNQAAQSKLATNPCLQSGQAACTQLTKPIGGSQVPEDAWELDVVVSDSAQGGSGAFYDNNGGFDYHVPTRNSVFARPKLSVVHVAVEMAPIAKAGPAASCESGLAPCSCVGSGQTSSAFHAALDGVHCGGDLIAESYFGWKICVAGFGPHIQAWHGAGGISAVPMPAHTSIPSTRSEAPDMKLAAASHLTAPRPHLNTGMLLLNKEPMLQVDGMGDVVTASEQPNLSKLSLKPSTVY